MVTDLTLTNYQTRLPSFEGPLDLLLHLIERQRLDISEISLVTVTDQFPHHIASLETREPRIIAEFTSVGTRLTVLKSRSLLPRPPAVDEEDVSNPDDLVEQLRAYQRVKAAASTLGRRLHDGYTAYAPMSMHAVVRVQPATEPRLATYQATVLLKAIHRRLSIVPKTVHAIPARKIVSLREMTDRMLNAISRVAHVRFSHATADARTRTERATAFLAVLVLVRRGVLKADQAGLFAEIDLSQGETRNPDMLHDMETEFVN